MSNRLAGQWIFVASIAHTVFGLILYQVTMASWFHQGLWSAIETYEDRAAMFFLFSGILLALLGRCIVVMQRVPNSVTAVLLIASLVGAILLPKSGFLLILPPAIGLLRRNLSVT